MNSLSIPNTKLYFDLLTSLDNLGDSIDKLIDLIEKK